jgi:LPS O-antigen subunit length determinant protein (WzzB/FepE family)
MAELPERKVLKEVLSDLKAKTLRSKSNAEKSTKDLLEFLTKIKGKAYEIHERDKEMTGEESPAKLVFTYVDNIENSVVDLIKEYLNALEDVFMYVKWLENYSIELDKTLYDAIETGKKMAEEQIKEQSELMKKKDDSYIK